MDELYFKIRTREGKESHLPIDRFPFTIGRGEDNDLVLTDPSVSRDHAFLRFSSNGIALVDNRSSNGSFVNNSRVADFKSLKHGDSLRLGSVELQFLTKLEEELAEKPGKGTDAVIEFVPARKDWDAGQSFSTAGAGALPSSARSSQGFEWIFKLFVDAPLSEVYEKILDLIEETIPFDRCFLMLFKNGVPEDLEIVARRSRSRRTKEIEVSTDILSRVARSGEAVLVSAGDLDSMPSESFIQSGASTAICMPFLVKGQVIGVLYLDRFEGRLGLSPGDLEKLGPLAGFVALKIQNVRLMEDHISNQILMRDLELAQTIQEGLLPGDPVRVSGYSIEGYSTPCYQVGGDYFDFLQRDDGTLTLVLGDVSGKGFASALYMAGIRSALHAHHCDGLDLDELVARLDHHAEQTFRSEFFVTLVVGDLNLETGEFTYINAGHLPPLIVGYDGKVRDLPVTDPALNICSGGTFTCNRVILQPGDVLFIYTDGLVEALSDSGEFFEYERLEKVLVENRAENLTLLRRQILHRIEEFTGDRSPNDDRTLILVRREWDSGEESFESHTQLLG